MNSSYNVVGVLAHVDAGKTTLSEAILYNSGVIRTLGRVDKRDTFLDTNHIERERGITIFSKQARIKVNDRNIILLDTPGHMDFSAETERTLPLLDAAILVVSGIDGVQVHTKTLFKLLRRYHIPVSIFVNKMDMDIAVKDRLFDDLKEALSDRVVDFSDKDYLENVAMCDEEAMEYFLEHGDLPADKIKSLYEKRLVIPCYFGSALKNEGVRELIDGMADYLPVKNYPDEFAAKVYKIGRDSNGTRLTYMKLTGGSVKVKEMVGDEKVNQIRQYSGEAFTQVDEAFAGEVVAITGLNSTFAGQGLGTEPSTYLPELTPVLSYRLILPADADPVKLYKQIQEIEEEEPLMEVSYRPEKGGIIVKMMGEIQCDILKVLVKERFDIDIEFAEEGIVYLETIANAVEGIGHYEPLRHYAEVHVLIEPAKRGSRISADSAVRDDVLDKNWQRLIMTHIMEKRHKGVLTGSELTDVKITVIGGMAHKKHTEGGDFRQATYRAIRQGLMQAENILLEPVYSFTMTLPSDKVGRAMTDVTERGGELDSPEVMGDISILKGQVPVSTFRGYLRELMEYTKGEGQLELRILGYAPCHNAEEVIKEFGYDPEADVSNPTGSVFCEHGAGFYVPWDEVRAHMHVESSLYFGEVDDVVKKSETRSRTVDMSLTEEELEDIFKRTFAANKNDSKHEKKRKPLMQSAPKIRKSSKLPVFKDRYLLVDGYNVIFEMNKGNEVDSIDLSGMRVKLQDILCNYQAYKKINLILVFDAYKVKNNPGQYLDYHNIHVVYTKEKQTADAYIEAFTHEHGKTYDITVATSDGLEQLIVMGQGARRMSSRELLNDIDKMENELREFYLDREF